MSNRLIIAALLAVCSTTFAQPSKDKPKDAAKPSATQPPKGDKPAAPGADDMQKMMEGYMKAAMPGPQHAHLTKGVGTWDGKLKSYEDPTQPPKESTCVSTVKSILGGRFVQVDVVGEEMMPGAGPFLGHGINGYDNTAEKYTYFWIDSMGTGSMTGTGELSADKKVMTWTLSYVDPITKKASTMREIEKKTGENTFTMEMYGPGPDGKEAKMMVIDFTRRTDSAKPGTTK